MIWSLRVSREARASLRKFPKGTRREVSAAVRALLDNPSPPDSEQLEDYDRYRKLYVGNYRVLYRMGKNAIHVFRIERKSASTYRGFNPGL